MRKGHRRYIGKLSELVKEDRWEERHGGGGFHTEGGIREGGH